MKKKNVKDLEEIYWLVVGIGIILSLMNIFYPFSVSIFVSCDNSWIHNYYSLSK